MNLKIKPTPDNTLANYAAIGYICTDWPSVKPLLEEMQRLTEETKWDGHTATSDALLARMAICEHLRDRIRSFFILPPKPYPDADFIAAHKRD